MAKRITDESAQENSKKAINSLSKEAKKVGKFLLGVINGSVGDEVFDKDGNPILDKSGKQIKRKATLQVRVQAARTYKELILDKIVPDKKHDPKVKNKDANTFAEALRQVHEEQVQQAAANAEKN